MTTISTRISRTFLIVAIAAVGLSVTPRTASADFVDFTVNEGVVPGSAPFVLTADLLNGGYTELLTLTPSAPGSTFGTFSAIAFAEFSAYYLNGGQQGSQIGGVENVPPGNTSSYRVNSEFTATGTYSLGPSATIPTCPVNQQCFLATPGTGLANVYLDPANDTLGVAGGWVRSDPLGDDILILQATNLLPGSGGQFDTLTLPNPTGNFNLFFGTNALIGLGNAYWPTLSGLLFQSVVNGDFNSVAGSLQQIISGDVSAQFTAIPEPATLTLLGLGLAGAAARRRKKMQASKA